jgi:hypothetical protein
MLRLRRENEPVLLVESNKTGKTGITTKRSAGMVADN